MKKASAAALFLALAKAKGHGDNADMGSFFNGFKISSNLLKSCTECEMTQFELLYEGGWIMAKAGISLLFSLVPPAAPVSTLHIGPPSPNQASLQRIQTATASAPSSYLAPGPISKNSARARSFCHPVVMRPSVTCNICHKHAG